MRTLDFIKDFDNIVNIMDYKGYEFYENDSKDYNLNIIGWRTKNLDSQTYNDYMTCSWIFEGSIHNEIFVCTTDPGLYYLENPMNVKGTLIMKPGQYKGAYKLCGPDYNHGCKGHGSNLRKCLRQIKPIAGYRDVNRDNIYDFDEDTVETGMFSANIHDPWSFKEGGDNIYKDSAGCQVLVTEHYKWLIGNNDSLAERAVENWGNSFTYTLIDWRDIDDYLKHTR